MNPNELLRWCPECGGARGTTDYVQLMGGTVPRFVSCARCGGRGVVPVERKEARMLVAGVIRRELWCSWGEYVPDGDETLASLGGTAVEGYLCVADAVVDALAAAGTGEGDGK